MIATKTIGNRYFWPFFEKVVIEGLDMDKISGCSIYNIHGNKVRADMENDGNRFLISTRGLRKGVYCVKFKGMEDYCRIFVVSK